MSQIDVDRAIEQYFARIHRAALVLTGNPWDADDLAQETFLVFTRRHEAFRGQSSLFTWLYGILLNLDRQERRRHVMRRQKLQVVWDQEKQQEHVMPPAETPLEVAEWRNSLWARVAGLPDGQRQALVLRFSEHLRYDEIAEVMQCPLGTVKSRIYHGLHALRRTLDTARPELAGSSPDPDELRTPPEFPEEGYPDAI